MIRSPTIRLEEAALDFRLLGPLEVADGGRVLALGGAKQRALLAVLLLRANEVVSIDRLIDELWGDEPPPTAAKVVQVYVSQLRKALAQAGREPVIMTRPPGYVARVEPGELDVARFERELDRARRARSAGNPEEATRLLREALALWRGQALADFSYEPFAQPAIARLEELRLAALEERVESDLALGRDSDLVGEVEALVARVPAAGGSAGPADAGALPLRASGRGARGVPAGRGAFSSTSSGSTRAHRCRSSRRQSCARIRSSSRRRPAVTTRRPRLRHRAPLPRSGRSSWPRGPCRPPPSSSR